MKRSNCSKTTDLLVFDDIGAENLNSWARDHVMGQSSITA